MNNPNRSSLSRRRFLQTTAAASAIFAAPYFIPTALRANERVNLGFIGVKNRGLQNMDGFDVLAKDGSKLNCTAAALCDVDSTVLASAASRVEKAGNKPQVDGDYRQCSTARTSTRSSSRRRTTGTR